MNLRTWSTKSAGLVASVFQDTSLAIQNRTAATLFIYLQTYHKAFSSLSALFLFSVGTSHSNYLADIRIYVVCA